VRTNHPFEPFGNTTVAASSTTSSFAYTGRELDATGLYFYRARYYYPQLQRFLSEDLIRFKGGPNFYAYVFNSPPNEKDPFGRSGTVNLGGNLNVSFGGLNWTFSGGIVIDDSGNIGSYLTTGLGAAVNTGIHASFGLTGGVSSGRNICSFGGPFVEVGASGGLGPAGGASGYVGFESDGTPIIGTSLSGGVGVGAEASVNVTETGVTPIFGRQCACP